MIASVNVTAGKVIAKVLGATDPNAWVAFAVQAQWENGGTVRGNNPLNLTDPGRHLYWRAYGQTGWYAGGTAAEWHTDFAAFASLDGGARAAAANYLGQGSYGAVIAACRSGAGPIPIADAIESSPWSSGHYGGKLAGRVSAELAALFASTAAAKLPPQEVHPVSEQLTTFTPPMVGTVPPGTLRRFAADPPHAEILPPLELTVPERYEFTGRLVIDSADVPHGTFAVTGTQPPFLVIGSVPSFDAPPAAVPDPPAPVAAPPSADPNQAVAVAQAMATLDPATQAAWQAQLDKQGPGAVADTYTPAVLLARWQLRAAQGIVGTALTESDVAIGLAYATARAQLAGVTPAQMADARAGLALEAAGIIPVGTFGTLDGPDVATIEAELAVNHGQPWTADQITWSNAHGGAIPPAGI